MGERVAYANARCCRVGDGRTVQTTVGTVHLAMLWPGSSDRRACMVKSVAGRLRGCTRALGNCVSATTGSSSSEGHTTRRPAAGSQAGSGTPPVGLEHSCIASARARAHGTTGENGRARAGGSSTCTPAADELALEQNCKEP